MSDNKIIMETGKPKKVTAVRSSDNVISEKERTAKANDFLAKMGLTQYQAYIKSLEAPYGSSDEKKAEAKVAQDNICKNSFVMGSAIFHEILLKFSQTNFKANVQGQLLVAAKEYKDPEQRYLVLTDYFLQHGKRELAANPMEANLDTESFLTGFCYGGSNMFGGIVTWELTRITRTYSEFIKLADKHINKK